MDKQTLQSIIGITTAVCFLMASVSNTLKLLKTKKSDDISISREIYNMIGTFLTVGSAWVLTYSPAILIGNIPPFLTSLFNFFLILKYKTNLKAEINGFLLDLNYAKKRILRAVAAIKFK